MWVCNGKFILDFYNNDNLALKHRNIEKLCKEIRRHFNISILETEDNDNLERCVVGFSLVAPEHWERHKMDEFIQKICQTVDTTAFARVTSEDYEILARV